ncbi:hypothetical protein ACIOFV_07480 [Streptomyces mirabilis]|uniref:hypothetical protein n=1 Tax=Streptomyces mirabilis TaxID=68239 RepID=UPI00382BEA51
MEALCASVDDVFARPASREKLRAMVRGLLSEVRRKNLWQLAEFAGHPNPDRLQGFPAKAAWDGDQGFGVVAECPVRDRASTPKPCRVRAWARLPLMSHIGAGTSDE